MKKGNYSFGQWCIDHDKQWLIDTWCNDLNGIDPFDVSHAANVKYYFWCGNPKHHPELMQIDSLSNKQSKTSYETFCTGCKSIGQYIADHMQNVDIDKLWSNKNTDDPFSVSAGSAKHIWLRCQNENHPHYDIAAYNVKNSIACPFCSGKRVCYENSLMFKMPNIVDVWSEKNTLSPAEYTTGSNAIVFFKCENGVHDDYERKICANVRIGFKCPECSKKNRVYVSGEAHPAWNPNLDFDKRERKSQKYALWRDAVFKRDGYKCQCCGAHNCRLNAHHINSFSSHKDERYDIDNGITLCSNCHDSTLSGSLHNMYGTHDIDGITLEKYINEKRSTLGIKEPFYISCIKQTYL